MNTVALIFALLVPAALQDHQLRDTAAEDASGYNLADLGWLEGCWQGSGFGKRVTECWMRAPAGRLTGMFQMIGENGEQEFSEIFVLDEFEGGAAIRLKHFDPELVGWEAQDGYVVFELRETGPDFARFDGLTYRLSEDGRLIAELSVTRNGERETERLEFELLHGPGD
jgi:hypothetical protein